MKKKKPRLIPPPLNPSYQQSRSKEHGATFVEFSIVALIFFGIIGAGIDFGLALWRYNNLTHAMNVAARSIAIEFGNRSDEQCLVLESDADQSAKESAESLFASGTIVTDRSNLSDNPARGDISIVSDITTTTLSITSQMKLQCMFCIFFPGGGPILSTKSQSLIENSTFTCM